MRNDFNLIAKVYDVGVSAVFGKVVKQSYTYFLDRITSTDRVLIVGGGTGQILNHISPTCEIHYVDQSREMIQLAQQRRNENIMFFEIDFFDFKESHRYDWIVFPYFLDLFNEDEVTQIFKSAGSMLTKKGKFIVTDFALPKRVFQKTLLSIVIKVLRPLVKLQITQLSSIQAVLIKGGYQVLALKEWREGFIFSGIYHHRETF